MATPYEPNSHRQRMAKRASRARYWKLLDEKANAERSFRWAMADRAEALRSGEANPERLARLDTDVQTTEMALNLASEELDRVANML